MPDLSFPALYLRRVMSVAKPDMRDTEEVLLPMVLTQAITTVSGQDFDSVKARASFWRGSL